MSAPTPIEIVREHQRWRRAQGQYAGLCQCPHTPEEIGLALDSVLRDAERYKALERAFEIEQLRNAQRQAHNAIYVAQQLEKKVDELEALDELTTNQAKEYLARAEAAEARVKELEAVRQDLLGKIVGWQDGHREDQERIAKLRAALKSLQSDAQCTIDLYNKNGPTWTSRDSGAEYYDASYVIDSAEERIATIKAALADTKGTT